MALVILKQAVLMLLLMLVGVIAYETKIVSKEGGKEFSNFVLEIVTPVLVVNAYADVEYDSDLVVNLLWTFLLAAVSHVIAIGIAYLCVRDKPDRETRIERFSAIYSNCGFMGFPLAEALLGSEGVFYCSAYLTMFFAFSWSHGIMMLTGERDWKALLKKMTSPTIIGIVIGLLLFFLQIDLPDVLQSTLDYVSDLNTPMAMVAAGISVAQSKIWEGIKNPRVYYVSAVKLVFIPLVLAVLLAPMTFISEDVRTVVLVLSAAPSAGMCTLQCQKRGMNDGYASQIFAICTLLSTLTMPLMVQIFTFLTDLF